MKWIKKGHIFKPKGNLSWSSGYAQIPRALVLEDKIRIFYATRYFDDQNSPISQTSYIDVDNKDLSKILYVHNKPSLELGSKGEFSEFGIHPTMLISHKDSTYFFYQGWQRGKEKPYSTEIGVAISKDNGLSFSKMGAEPVLKKSIYDPNFVNGVFILPLKNSFQMWYSSGKEWIKNENKLESVYQIKSAVSQDLRYWETNFEFCIKPRFHNECQNSATVIRLNNRYHMWFCYRPALNFRNKDNGYRIGYAWSDDKMNWNRDDSKAGIDISSNFSWDSQMICYPYVFKVNGKILMLYCGNYFGESGFGYAELEIN